MNTKFNLNFRFLTYNIFLDLRIRKLLYQTDYSPVVPGSNTMKQIKQAKKRTRNRSRNIPKLH